MDRTAGSVQSKVINQPRAAHVGGDEHDRMIAKLRSFFEIRGIADCSIIDSVDSGLQQVLSGLFFQEIPIPDARLERSSSGLEGSE
jgi:hypothetical protein